MRAKMMAFLLAGAFTVTAAMAQPRERMTPQEMAKAQTERLHERVKLTDSQKEQVLKIHEKYVPQRTETQAQQRRQQTEKARQERRTEMEKRDLERDQELKKVLTSEQWNEYEKMKAERPADRNGRNNRR